MASLSEFLRESWCLDVPPSVKKSTYCKMWKKMEMIILNVEMYLV